MSSSAHADIALIFSKSFVHFKIEYKFNIMSRGFFLSFKKKNK